MYTRCHIPCPGWAFAWLQAALHPGVEGSQVDILLWLQHPVFLTFGRGLLAFVFVSAAIGKVRQPRRFAAAVAAYHLLPPGWASPLAYALLAGEAALGLMLLSGWQTRFAAMSSGLLMLVFILAVAINLARGRTNLECGCRGEHHQKVGARVIGRDVFYLLLSAQLALWGGGLLAADHLSPTTQQWIADTLFVEYALPLALALAGVGLLYGLGRRLGRLISLIPVE